MFKKKWTKFQKEAFQTHNYYRALHKSPPLNWSNELAKNASIWAHRLAKIKSLEHEDLPGEGENIAFTTIKNPSGKKTTEAWYSEQEHYDYNNPENSGLEVYHFTQIVWAGSKEFGIAVYSDGKQSYIVARYSPPGNVKGEFQSNISPPLQKMSEFFEDSMQIENELMLNEDYRIKIHYDEVIPQFKEQLSHDKIYLSRYRNEMLQLHNQTRVSHGVMPLWLNENLSNTAQILAESLLIHKLGKGPEPEFPTLEFGKSISFVIGKELPHPRSICSSWYNGKQFYDYKDPKFNFRNGGFTQMIWKSTKYVGFGVFWGEDRSVIVALYTPAGNIRGNYLENVEEVKSINVETKI